MIPIQCITGRLGNQMFQFAYLLDQSKKGTIPDVYLQDEYFFKESAGEIRNLYSGGIGFTPYVSIHVRRGDYVGNSFYADLFEDGYYKRAMELFLGEQFLVFSDDITWCKGQELFKECAFAEGNDAIEDMNMMASCKHNIIANSSFSWWAAWLNPSPLKKIVAPKSWFSGDKEISLPNSWIRI